MLRERAELNGSKQALDVIAGKYEVIEEIGQSAAGSTYKVRHTLLDSVLRVTVLAAEVSADRGRLGQLQRRLRDAMPLQLPSLHSPCAERGHVPRIGSVPVCTARRNLHVHHLVFRSRGGGNGRENRITLCAWHHLRGIHAGRVRAEGNAPDALTWEIGVCTGKRPLLRLIGERRSAGGSRHVSRLGLAGVTARADRRAPASSGRSDTARGPSCAPWSGT